MVVWNSVTSRENLNNREGQSVFTHNCYLVDTSALYLDIIEMLGNIDLTFCRTSNMIFVYSWTICLTLYVI